MYIHLYTYYVSLVKCENNIAHIKCSNINSIENMIDFDLVSLYYMYYQMFNLNHASIYSLRRYM